MKKVIAILSALMMLLTLLPAGILSVSAAVTSDGYRYTVSGGKATITGYTGAGGVVTIPATVGGYSVTSIGENAFLNCTKLTSVSVSNGITAIGDYAFRGCTGLTKVSLPKSVATLSDNLFLGCEKLATITVSVNNSKYCAVSNVLFNKNKTELLQYPMGKKDTTYSIPEGVEIIGDYAFSDCSVLTSVTIPSSVTTIDRYAFYKCTGLTSVTIPKSVTTLGNYSFYNCAGLTSVTIPKGVTTIGTYAFSLCAGLTSVVLPNSVTTLGHNAFYKCANLASVTLSTGITSIGQSSFSNCPSLAWVIIPSGVESIGKMAFSNCPNLVSVTLPTSVTSIGDDAFSECDALRYVWYAGTSQKKISILSGNSDLKNATWSYKVQVKNGHVYYNACDASCNACGAIRTPSAHQYSDCTDSKCNVCNASRTAGKCRWDSCKDTKCNVCGKSRTALKHKYTSEKDLTCNTCSFARKKITSLTIKGIVTPLLGETVKAFKKRLSLSFTHNVKDYDVDIAVNGEVLKDTATIKANTNYTLWLSFSEDDYDVVLDKNCKVTVDKGSVLKSMNTFYDGEWLADIYVKLKVGKPLSITTQPKTTYAKKNATAKVTVKAKGSGLKYTWYIKNAGSSKYGKSSVKTATYSVKMTSTAKNRLVYCVVTDKYGNKVQTKTIALREGVSITTQPKTVTVKKNTTAKVSVKASGDGLKYTWYIKNAGSSKYGKSSVKTATYSAKMTSAAKNRLVYCVVTDKYGNTVKTVTVQLKMK